MSKRSNYYETNEKIICAISLLMDEVPVDKISVTMICKKADINRSTFYDHFKTVDDAISLVDKELMKKFRDILVNETCIGASLLTKLFKLIDDNKEFFKKQYILGNKLQFAEFFRVLYIECKAGSGKYVARFWDAGLNALIKTWLLNDINKNYLEMTELFTIYLDNRNV